MGIKLSELDLGKLTNLYNRLKSQGCKSFGIDGGDDFKSLYHGIIDETNILVFENPFWMIYYTSRGQRSGLSLTTIDVDEAIDKYEELIVDTHKSLFRS